MKSFAIKLERSEFKLLRLQEAPAPDEVLDQPERVIQWLRPQLLNSPRYSPDVENFMVIHLNTRCRPIGWEVTSNGTIDTLLVHPREVFRSAIVMNAHSIIMAHNHPSGDPCPSEADIKITRDLIRNGQQLRIEVKDSLILGQATLQRPKDYASLRELGYFYS